MGGYPSDSATSLLLSLLLPLPFRISRGLQPLENASQEKGFSPGLTQPLGDPSSPRTLRLRWASRGSATASAHLKPKQFPSKPAKTHPSTPKHPQPQHSKPHLPGTTTLTNQLQFN